HRYLSAGHHCPNYPIGTVGRNSLRYFKTQLPVKANGLGHVSYKKVGGQAFHGLFFVKDNIPLLNGKYLIEHCGKVIRRNLKKISMDLELVSLYPSTYSIT